MILDEIVRDKRVELEERRRAAPRAELERRCRDLPSTRDFEAALLPPPGGVRLVAEVKRASPSRGLLVADFDPVRLARTYAEHGAAAVSVLTDRKYFQGSLEFLAEVRAAVPVPLLRKDFTIDEYQLWESRAAGADAVLLIVAILEPGLLRDLTAAARGIGLAALVEAHTGPELERALGAGARIVGINNRDLRTFQTRIETTLELAPMVPPGPIVVSESGLERAEQVRAVVAAGAHAILVGEGLVTAPDPGAKVRELISAPDAARSGSGRPGAAEGRGGSPPGR
jgi:indole-3-glycerol phosphate synthase